MPRNKISPLALSLASKMEGKQTRIARKSVLNPFFLSIPSSSRILGRRLLGKKLGKGSSECASGADFLYLLLSLVVLLFPPEPCSLQHCSAANCSQTISPCEKSQVTVTAILSSRTICAGVGLVQKPGVTVLHPFNC